MSDTCIRVLADPVQIKDCREAILTNHGELAELARVYSLIGNPTRLKMMYLIIREGEMCPCDLSDILDISVGGVSQHLRKLKDGGLIVDRKVGQTIFLFNCRGKCWVVCFRSQKNVHNIDNKT